MNFRSELILPVSEWQFGHEARILAFGSCFADTMARRLEKNKFKTLSNPFGVIYNPLALLHPLEAALEGKNPFSEELFERNQHWYSYGMHSKMSHSNRDFLEQMIDSGLKVVGGALETADVLILTFGTAIAFRHLERDEIVANCHKVPAKAFKKEMLSLEVMQKRLQGFLEKLYAKNPDIQVLLTVSPVRHLRSGIVENSISKALLRLLVNEAESAHKNTTYFPAYELMMDDLRDYRFYKRDLMHPTDMAEEYIWGKFSASFIREQAREKMRELEAVFRDLGHRPSAPAAESNLQFLRNLREKLIDLNNYVDVSMELAEVEEKLNI